MLIFLQMYASKLIARVEEFGRTVVKFAKLIPKKTVTMPLISQFIRAGTSIGANYFEADNAESKNDFIHKAGIAKKEAKETGYWIKMIIEAEPNLKSTAMDIYQESVELSLILSSMVNKARQNNSK